MFCATLFSIGKYFNFFVLFNCVYYLIARNDDDHQFLNIQPPHVTLTCRMIDSWKGPIVVASLWLLLCDKTSLPPNRPLQIYFHKMFYTLTMMDPSRAFDSIILLSVDYNFTCSIWNYSKNIFELSKFIIASPRTLFLKLWIKPFMWTW